MFSGILVTTIDGLVLKFSEDALLWKENRDLLKHIIDTKKDEAKYKYIHSLKLAKTNFNQETIYSSREILKIIDHIGKY